MPGAQWYYFRYRWWPEAQRQIPCTAALETSIRRLNLTFSYKYGELLPQVPVMHIQAAKHSSGGHSLKRYTSVFAMQPLL